MSSASFVYGCAMHWRSRVAARKPVLPTIVEENDAFMPKKNLAQPKLARVCTPLEPERLREAEQPEQDAACVKKEGKLGKRLQVDVIEGKGLHVCWYVDAQKIRTNDNLVASPAFELLPGVSFKLMIKASETGCKKGQTGFKAAKGKGKIQLRCNDSDSASDAPKVSFSMSSGSEKMRGCVTHDFSQGVVCGLPSGEDEWDFAAAIDSGSQKIAIHLEIMPHMRL